MKLASELNDGDCSKCPQCEKESKDCKCPITDFFNLDHLEY